MRNYENYCYYYLHSEVKRDLAGVKVTAKNFETTLNGEIYLKTFCTYFYSIIKYLLTEYRENKGH